MDGNMFRGVDKLIASLFVVAAIGIVAVLILIGLGLVWLSHHVSFVLT